jgi:molecular chaperone DnaJ
MLPGVDNGNMFQIQPGAGVTIEILVSVSPHSPLLTSQVLPHEHFRRDGLDILVEVPLTFPEAALGAEVSIQTLTGTKKHKISAGTQPGYVETLRGQGVVTPSAKGNLRILYRLKVPT